MEDLLTKEQKLLINEGGLSSTCLGQGLTILRKANFVNRWNYYQGFFLLTIGLERLLKLVIISHYRHTKGRFPEDKFLKNCGHDIGKLISMVASYEGCVITIFNDSITADIASFFTAFAKYSRYYNLDALSVAMAQPDPLVTWKGIQERIKVQHQLIGTPPPEAFMKVLDESFSFIQHDEAGKLITDPRDYYHDYRILDKVQGYSIYYCWKIITEIAASLRHFEYAGGLFPTLREFFPYFNEIAFTKREIVKRKNWNYLA